MEIHIYMDDGHDDTIKISFEQVRFIYDTTNCSLLKAFEYYIQSRFRLNVYSSKIVDLQIRLHKHLYYTFPTFTKPTIDYDKVLTECNRMWDMLNHPHMSIPDCYINICTHMRSVLTMEEFDEYNGGEVLSAYDIEELFTERYDLLYLIVKHIDWKALTEDYYHDKELTAPDLYTGIRYVINR